MFLVCRLIVPAISSRSGSSSFTNGRYGQTWAVLSRCHIASMSPVMT